MTTFQERDIERHPIFGSDGKTKCPECGAPVGNHAVCAVAECEGLAERVIWRNGEDQAVCASCAEQLAKDGWEVE